MSYMETAHTNAAQFEGLRLVPYKDSAGIWTIGYGYNLESHGVLDLYPGATFKICREQAEVWLSEELAVAEQDARYLYSAFDSFPDAIKATLIDLAYNMGRSSLSSFKNMNAAIARQDWRVVAEELKDSKYYRQTGHRARYHCDLFTRAAQRVPRRDRR